MENNNLELRVKTFTSEQKNATFTKNKDLLVSAGAGAGKTKVLVERVIQTILDESNNINIDEFLICTFTKLASFEMKERIYKAINDELKKSPNNENLITQLSLINKSTISTLDSVFSTIVKNNFKVVCIDPNFKIANPNSSIELLTMQNTVLEELFNKYYEEKNQDFINFMNLYSETSDDENIFDIIINLHNSIQNNPYPMEWLEQQQNSFYVNTKEDFFNSKIFKYIISQTEKIIKNAKEYINFYDLLDTSVHKFILSDIEICNTILLCIKNKQYENLFNYFKEFEFANITRKNKFTEDEFIIDIIKRKRDLFKNFIKFLKEQYFSYDLDFIISQINKMNPHINVICKIIKDFHKKFMELKKEKNIFSFTDISHFCIDILIEKKDGKELPTKIAKQYHKKFKEIIIDEYQDINLIQEKILYALSNRENKFMVGDLKQSIYKFRNANPNIFMEKFNYFKNDTDNTKDRIDLNKNFRSNKYIINSINFLFEQLMSLNFGGVDYHKNSKLLFNDNSFCYDEYLKCVDIFIINKKDEEITYENENNKNTTDANNEVINLKNAELEANFIASKIKELISNKIKIPNPDFNPHLTENENNSKEKYIDYKDIVILKRNVKKVGETFMSILQANDIPAFAKTSSKFFSLIEVNTIISLLKIINNPLQDIHLITVLHSPIFSISADELIEIRINSKNTYFYNAIKNYISLDLNDKNVDLLDKLKYFLDKLKTWENLSHLIQIDELLIFLYNETNYYNYLSLLYSGDKKQKNLTALVEKAVEFRNTNLNGLFQFLNYIENLKKSENDENITNLTENENLVKIMTIHGSKGLEFPIVFVAGLGEKISNNKNSNKIILDNDLGLGGELIEYLSQEQLNENYEDNNNHELLPKYSFELLNKLVIKNKIKTDDFSEELRILYVALTRAKEKLILVGCVKNIEKNISDWYLLVNRNSIQVNPNSIFLETSSLLDWICICLYKHSDDNILNHNMWNINPIIDNSKWNVEIIDKNKILINDLHKHKNVLETFEKLKTINFNKDISGLKEKIETRLNWEYPNKIETTIPFVSSISEIKRNFQREFLNSENIFNDTNNNFKIPDFIKEPISPINKGIIYHTILQHIDFNIKTENNILITINNLINKKLIPSDSFKVINTKKILTFLNCELCERIRISNKYYREKQFVINIPPYDIFFQEKYKNINSQVIVHGIIDLYFEENNNLILIDYKTDKFEKGNEKKLLEKYKLQLDVYKKALEQSTGKKVSEVILYSFHIDDFIKY